MTLPEFLYYLGYSIKKAYSLKHQKRLPYKVISIGNITVGGTGKTPATIAVAEEAKRRGFQPVILTRGYKGKAKGPCFVHASSVKREASGVKHQGSVAQRTTPDSPRLYGDEPVLMAERLKDVLIVKCADRYEGGMFALTALPLHRIEVSVSYDTGTPKNPRFLGYPVLGCPFTPSPIIFILDDGFQHWRLYRDKDILLIDGTNPFGNKKMLPMGPLREPLKELKRADIFVITKARNEALACEIKHINPDAPVYFSEYRMSGLRDSDGTELPIEILKDKKVYAFCGIANPESFRHTVLSVSGNLAGFKAYRDHYRYAEKDIFYLEKQRKALNCDFLVTTEKDMVKLKEIGLRVKGQWSSELKNLLYVEIGFYVNDGFFDEVFKGIL